MGRMVTCAVIVESMVAFEIFGYNYSDNRAKEIYITADGITQALDNDDNQKAAEMAAYAEDIWRGLSQDTIFVEDTECDNEIAMCPSRIKVLAKSGEDDIYSECAVIKRLIELYITRQH